MSNRHELRPTFIIKLRAAGYSWAGKALQNAFGGTSNVPLPCVAKECICCSAATERVQRIRVVAHSGRLNKPLELPMCEHCSSHEGNTGLAALLLCLCTGLFALGIVLGALNSLWWLVLSCLAPCVILTALLLQRIRSEHSQRRALIGAGHSPGIWVSAEPYMLTLITRNRRFARTLLELNPSAVLDHPHERFLYEPATSIEARTRAQPPASLPRSETRADEVPRFLT